MTSKPEPLKEKWNHPRSIQNSREEFQGWFWEEDVRSALQNFIRWLHNYSHLTPREMEMIENRLKWDFADVWKGVEA